jgi:hypothetical protein
MGRLGGGVHDRTLAWGRTPGGQCILVVGRLRALNVLRWGGARLHVGPREGVPHPGEGCIPVAGRLRGVVPLRWGFARSDLSWGGVVWGWQDSVTQPNALTHPYDTGVSGTSLVSGAQASWAQSLSLWACARPSGGGPIERPKEVSLSPWRCRCKLTQTPSAELTV